MLTDISFGGAALAGLLAFFSPCILPMVPFYFSYMGGMSVAELRGEGEIAPGAGRRLFISALFFALGVTTIFGLMGLGATAAGQAFRAWKEWLTYGAAAVIFVFGLHFLGVITIPILHREMRMDAGDRGGSAFGAYVLGLAFAFGWTPCIGPLLGTILSLAATDADATRGTALLAVYALGLGIPFLLSAIFINRAIGLMNRIKPHMKTIERVMGVLLIAVGLMLVSGRMADLSYWMLEAFPALGRLG